MEIKYFEKDDILSLKFNDNPIGKEISYDWHLHITYDKKNTIREITILDASKSGVAKIWFNMAMAVAYTGLSEATLRRKIKAKELQAYQPGRDYRFRKEDLDLFLKHAQKKYAS